MEGKSDIITLEVKSNGRWLTMLVLLSVIVVSVAISIYSIVFSASKDDFEITLKALIIISLPILFFIYTFAKLALRKLIPIKITIDKSIKVLEIDFGRNRQRAYSFDEVSVFFIDQEIYNILVLNKIQKTDKGIEIHSEQFSIIGYIFSPSWSVLKLRKVNDQFKNAGLRRAKSRNKHFLAYLTE